MRIAASLLLSVAAGWIGCAKSSPDPAGSVATAASSVVRPASAAASVHASSVPRPAPSASAVSTAPTVSTPRWNPAKTRAFIVCLAQFEGEPDGETSFSTDDRLDNAFVDLLKARGVPADKVVFLQDKHATAPAVQKALDDFLAASAPDETLLFYYGSHGGYDAKTGVYTFSTFEDSLPMTWAFETIEKRFKGSQAIMFADTCYSGGIVELAAKQTGRIAYFALSSTYRHNVGYSGWRFVDALMRAFSGSPVVDGRDSGHVDLETMADWTAHHMAFVASGRPEFVATKGFDLKTVIADTKGKKKHPDVGKYVMVDWHGKPYKAEVIDADGEKRKVHYTSSGSSSDEWVTRDRMHERSYPQHAVGSGAECSSSSKWYACTVLGSFDQMTLCHYEGWTSAWDEYMSMGRIRSAGTDGGAPRSR